MKRIIFDMDGTIADLYNVPAWLEKLRAYDASPYADARPLVNMNALARALHLLQRNGYAIVIVSWLSKEPTPAYDLAVEQAKRKWLARHLGSVEFDEMYFVPYGTPKEDYSGGDAILFDDNDDIRLAFERVGTNKAFVPSDIFPILRALY